MFGGDYDSLGFPKGNARNRLGIKTKPIRGEGGSI